MTDINDVFDQVVSFERYPKLKLEKVGAKARVRFINEGNFVSAESIQSVFKDKGVKGIKARDSLVFNVEKDGETFEFWVSRTNYTNIRQIGDIRNANNNSLIDLSVTIEKVSENDPTKSTYEITK